MPEQVVQTHQLGTGTRDGTRFLRDDGTWASPSSSGSGGGGSGALVPIQVIGPLTAAQATLPFSAIPQTGYRNLRLVLSARSTNASTNVNGLLQLNGDAGANYDYIFSSSGSAANLAAQTSVTFARVAGSTAPASTFTPSRVEFMDYTNTSKNRDLLWVSGVKIGSTNTSMGYDPGAGWWRSSSAITSITLSLSAGNFDIGTYACLYGEMDTAGVLLTPASNLLQETILTAAQATISIPNIPQTYRDLKVIISGRGDAAAVSVNLGVRCNGDSGNNYSTNSTGVEANVLGSGSINNTAQAQSYVHYIFGAATTPANYQNDIILNFLNYTGSTAYKQFSSLGAAQGATTEQLWAVVGIGAWANTSPITSLTLLLSSGNFVSGTVVRVYGEPAAAGGASVGTGTRLRISGNQAATTAVALPIAWDTEDNDADNQHYSSAANLTGTVAKTAGSATLVGTSTLFTTELSVGQVISVPGTATETAVVTAIASATSLTVATAFANTATGQTAARVNTAVIFRQPGFYTLETTLYSAALASGNVTLQYRLNGSTIIDQKDQAAINAAAGYELVTQRQFAQWDYVEVLWTQNSGGSVNITSDERTHWSIGARPTVIVAIPYVNVQDQKTAGTDGGTFTSGADQTRVLNTVASDSAGISSLSSNQITLPAGTYRCAIRAPAFAVNLNVAWLYNVTDSVVLVQGQNNAANVTGSGFSMALIEGRFTLTGTKALAVRHRCQTTGTTNGFGPQANSSFTVPYEVYTVAEFWKEG